MLTAVHSMQITGKKRDRASSEESSDDELVAHELLNPLAKGAQRKKARLGLKGCQWITVFGERSSMKQRCAPRNRSCGPLLLHPSTSSPLSCCQQSVYLLASISGKASRHDLGRPSTQECAWQYR